MKFLKLFIALFILVISACGDPLQERHINANVPEGFAEFEKIIQSDLNVYFSNRLKKQVTVQY